MTVWHQVKVFLEHAIGVSNDALHVILGVAVQLTAALVLRRPIGSASPLAVVFAFTLANEAVDLWTERWPDPGMQYGESAKDVILTMLLPSIFMLAARLRPRLFREQALPKARDKC
jgi:hypothetical protein